MNVVLDFTSVCCKRKQSVGNLSKASKPIMVRQITVTVPHEKVAGIRDVLHKQSIVHHLEIYNGEASSMIICKVVNKKTDEILQLLARYSVGIRYGHIDVVALTSTKPRIPTFRGTKPKSQRYMVTDRMSYDEMVDFIDSQIHLTFDYSL